MLPDPYDTPPPSDDLLELEVSAAYADKDFAQVKSLLLRPSATNDLKDTVLLTALRDNDVALARFVIEEAKLALSPERCIMMLFVCCRSQQAEAALYLSEKTAELGLDRVDAYELVFSRFNAERHADMADALLARAGDRQDALDKMLLAAAKSDAFAVIPKLLDMGARADADATVMYLVTTRCPRPFFEQKDEYLALVDKFLARYEDAATLDAALIVNSFNVPTATQYPEVIEKLLAKGADPFADNTAAARNLAGRDETRDWAALFAAAQEKDVALHRAQFDLLFGADFRTADLLQDAGGGDTGLTLAAKAKRLDLVLAAALKDSTAQLSAEAIAAQNARHQSALSLAIDRGDAATLLDPAYWAKADPEVLRKIEQALKPEQKQWLDLPRLSAAFDQHGLRQQAQKFKLQPRRP